MSPVVSAMAMAVTEWSWRSSVRTNVRRVASHTITDLSRLPLTCNQGQHHFQTKMENAEENATQVISSECAWSEHSSDACVSEFRLHLVQDC